MAEKRNQNPKRLEQPEDTKETAVLYDPQKGQGVYSNLALIRHSSEEFQIDFLVQNIGGPNQLVARIWTNPPHFKRLVKALANNLKKFESEYGEIKEQHKKEK